MVATFGPKIFTLGEYNRENQQVTIMMDETVYTVSFTFEGFEDNHFQN